MHRVLKPGGHFAVSDIVLLSALPDHIRNDVSAYVGCVSGAELLHDYVRLAFEAGFEDVTIPQIAHGSKLAATIAPEDLTPERRELQDVAARAVASIKLHGRKAE